MIYLDYNASTPIAPGGAGGDGAVPRRALRQPLERALGGRPGGPGRRTRSRRRSPTSSAARRRRSSSPAAAPSPTTPRCWARSWPPARAGATSSPRASSIRRSSSPATSSSGSAPRSPTSASTRTASSTPTTSPRPCGRTPSSSRSCTPTTRSGTIQPIAEIARVTREAGVLLHSDAAQSVGKIADQGRRARRGPALARRAQVLRPQGRRGALHPRGHEAGAAAARRRPRVRPPGGDRERAARRRPRRRRRAGRRPDLDRGRPRAARLAVGRAAEQVGRPRGAQRPSRRCACPTRST